MKIAITKYILFLILAISYHGLVCAESVLELNDGLTSTPPEDAIVLFNGSNHDEWLSQTAKKWEDSDGPADWKITDDGALEVVPNVGSLISRRRFSDFQLHFEFLLPQGDINGGVFLLARYEFGIKGSASEPEGMVCGAFENLKTPIRPSRDVQCDPSGDGNGSRWLHASCGRDAIGLSAAARQRKLSATRSPDDGWSGHET